MVSYVPAETANLPQEIAAVVAGRYWTLQEAKYGTYSYMDLKDALEIMEVDNENRRRDFEHQQMLRRLTYE